VIDNTRVKELIDEYSQVTHPDWMRFLGEITSGDVELIDLAPPGYGPMAWENRQRAIAYELVIWLARRELARAENDERLLEVVKGIQVAPTYVDPVKYRGSAQDYAEADLVVTEDGAILKDRHGLTKKVLVVKHAPERSRSQEILDDLREDKR
jgi:hypothetical protein